jgi:PAS domain S-box-containing protein
LVYNASLTQSGMVSEEMAPLGMGLAVIVIAYLGWALVLFWQERGQHQEPYLVYSIVALLAGVLLTGMWNVSFPFMSVSNAVAAALLAYAAVIRQLFNPLRELTAEMQHEIVERVRSEERFRALSAATFEGIGFHDHGLIVDANQQLAEIFGYEADELPGKLVSDLVAPEDQDLVESKTRMGGEEAYKHRAIRKDGSEISVEVRSKTISLGNRPVRVTAVRDVTEQVQAQEALRHYAERLQILHEIEQGILAARSPEAIAGVAVAHIRELIPCRRVSISLIDMERYELTVLAADAHGETEIDSGTQFSLEPFADLIAQVSENGVLLWTDLPSRGPIGEALYAEGLQAYLSAPLVFRGELIGALNLAGGAPDSFSQEHQELVRQVADQLAIAIHQAQLRDQVQRHAEELEQRVAGRTRELSVLYEVAALASQPLELDTTLAQSLDQVLDVIGGDSGTVHLLDESDGQTENGGQIFRLVAQRGVRADLIAMVDSFSVSNGPGEWILTHDEPLIVPDITADPRIRVELPIEPRSYLGIPLRASGRIVGVLGIVRRPDQPQLTVEELSLLSSIADQLGIVVESARLHAQAERAARLEERERLARELHDSVTQSLYSLTLFAEWARDLYQDGELEGVNERLVRIGETAQQALKEMRLLIYELRPSLLEQDGLVRALERRLDAVEKRVGVEVALEAEPLGKLPTAVEIGLYRIAQEALNNALKHAGASQVTVRAELDGRQATLEIEDDGAGFEVPAPDEERGMGLANMRERARQLGGELTVSSAAGEGTKVKVAVEVS